MSFWHCKSVNTVFGLLQHRWLLARPVHGTLFADYGSDLDSGETVIGDPAGTRGKPGRWVQSCSAAGMRMSLLMRSLTPSPNGMFNTDGICMTSL